MTATIATSKYGINPCCQPAAKLCYTACPRRPLPWLANTFFSLAFARSSFSTLSIAASILCKSESARTPVAPFPCHRDLPASNPIVLNLMSSSSQSRTVASADAMSIWLVTISCTAANKGSEETHQQSGTECGKRSGSPFTSRSNTWRYTGRPGLIDTGKPLSNK